jgi:outer membrane protein OmpA-like peptidoglycan-associated protein
MRTFLLKLGVLAVTSTALFASATALADDNDVTLRMEPGVAIPLTQPQVDRFTPGADLVLKPTIGITPWIDGSIVLSGMVLPSRISGINAGTAFGGGLGLRVKRPHDRSNTGTGFSAVSPWIDADAQLLGTGPLARAALSVGVGAAVPTSDARNVWIGPFLRYTDIVDSTDSTPGFNNTDAHVLIAGLSIEIGPKVPKQADPDPTPPPPPVVVEEKRVPVPPVVQPPADVVEVIHMHVKVQFPFDSAVPLQESMDVLQKAAETILTPGAVVSQSIGLVGHASSEGQVGYNDKLSVRRAQAVADLLVKNGVSRDRLIVSGRGSRVPVASNKTEAGRVQNRRVEFIADVTITKAGGK